MFIVAENTGSVNINEYNTEFTKLYFLPTGTQLVLVLVNQFYRFLFVLPLNSIHNSL